MCGGPKSLPSHIDPDGDLGDHVIRDAFDIHHVDWDVDQDLVGHINRVAVPVTICHLIVSQHRFVHGQICRRPPVVRLPPVFIAAGKRIPRLQADLTKMQPVLKGRGKTPYFNEHKSGNSPFRNLKN